MTKTETNQWRAWAIMAVILYHLQAAVFEDQLLPNGTGLFAWWRQLEQVPYAWLGWPAWLGIAGVNLFFALSGYGLVKSRQQKPKEVARVRLWRRIKRVWVPYAVAHPVTHLLAGLVAVWVWHDSLTWPIWLSWYPWQNYLISLLLLPRWWSEQNMFVFVGSWWFVGVIVQFYLVFPWLWKLLTWLGRDKFWLTCLAMGWIYRLILVVSSIAAPVAVRGSQHVWWLQLPARLPEFATGMYLANGGRRAWWWGWWWLPLAGLLSSWAWGWVMSDWLLAVGMWDLVARLNRYLPIRWRSLWATMGLWSYYIYLYHEPLLGWLVRGY